MPTEKDKMLDGELYDASDPELVDARERARDLTRQYNRTTPDEESRRRELLDDLLGSHGEPCFIEPPFRCDYGFNIHVGDGLEVNFDCVILDVCRVDIGDDCLIGPGVHIYTATHPVAPDERASGLEYGKPVSIGDTVWIGGHATINPGVTVGDDAVIASGAVVTDDVPAGVVVGGNPATVITEVDASE